MEFIQNFDRKYQDHLSNIFKLRNKFTDIDNYENPAIILSDGHPT